MADCAYAGTTHHRFRSTYRAEIAYRLDCAARKRRRMARDETERYPLNFNRFYDLIASIRTRQDSADFWQPIP